MNEQNQFDWVNFYKEFASKLLDYKDRRDELVEKVKAIYTMTGMNMPTLEKDNNLIDIDPFTVFGLFNKKLKDDNRIKILTARKPLAALLGEYKNTKPKYLRAPSYGYQIGDLLLTREGNIESPDTMTKEEFDELLTLLDAGGYRPEETDFHPAEVQEAAPTEETGLTITIPLDKVKVGNLTNLLDAKGSLIKHALHIEDLRFELNEDSIFFPWFKELPEPDEVHAYSALIAALCKMSKEQKRVSATEKPVDNERYAFRCFLLRLGFIGDEYKTDRKILMRYLPGNSAFKGGEGHAISK